MSELRFKSSLKQYFFNEQQYLPISFQNCSIEIRKNKNFNIVCDNPEYRSVIWTGKIRLKLTISFTIPIALNYHKYGYGGAYVNTSRR